MKKSKAPNIAQKIIDAYQDYLSESGKAPESVTKFCKSLKITERVFFQNFSSLEDVESHLWSNMIIEVIQSVESGKEFNQFNAEQRLLVFGFAFLEKSLDYRSTMLLRFKKIGPFHLSCSLEGFSDQFKSYAQRIVDHGKKTGEIANRSKLLSLYKEGLYLVFQGLIQFNLRDKSQGFERSDAYWEKSVKLCFDLMKSQAIDSAFDLAKFLIPQKS
ncbi:MAG: hypothetical protein V4507_10110 [Verrucomicrobiota bacterium]